MASVIMVEDDLMIGDIYRKKFEAAGFDITIATSGKEFLAKLKEKKFDLVLLDMVLPGMSGMEILQELKKSGKYDPDMAVFIFSNLGEKEEHDKAIQNGADGYILKTQYNPTELVGEVTRLLNQVQERKKNEMKSRSEMPAGSQEKKKILFIEDEEVFLDMFVKKLEDSGYLVEKATNGAWGMKEALNKNFDLIITDMVMPAMEGTEIVKRLKQEEKTKNIPIIVLSASSTEEKTKEVLDLGAKDFFLKTRIVPSDLSRRVDEILK